MIPKEIRTEVVMAFCFVMAFWLALGWHNRASRSAAEGKVATAQANAAGTAVIVSDGQNQAEVASRETEAANREDILNAPNASETAGDAGLRGMRSLCGRVQYRSDPRCAGL